MAEPVQELNQIEPKLVEDGSLKDYGEFKRHAKALSHIKVKRDSKLVGDYFHHFIIISITKYTDILDVVTVGHYTSSGELFTESSQGIGKFTRERIILGEGRTHDIFDFAKGLYLVDDEDYPNTEDQINESFGRLEEMINERKYELSSNNCEHSINYILTGKNRKGQTDTKMLSKRCLIDLCDVFLIDCKDVGFKTALAVAALGAIAGALVRRAYVNVVVAAIVSHTVGNTVEDCGILIGSNIRSEAQRKIDQARQLPDINKIVVDNNINVLDGMENHLKTTFVCKLAEKLICDAILKTCAATFIVAVGLETIFLLFYVNFNLVSRRRRHVLCKEMFCRILFLRMFGGYCSILVAVFPIGIPAFLYIDRPTLAFFCLVFICSIVLRYIFTLIAGFCFDCCCCSCWYNCCNCCSCCKSCCDFRCWTCSCSTLVVFVVVLLITVGMGLALGLYILA